MVALAGGSGVGVGLGFGVGDGSAPSAPLYWMLMPPPVVGMPVALWPVMIVLRSAMPSPVKSYTAPPLTPPTANRIVSKLLRQLWAPAGLKRVPAKNTRGWGGIASLNAVAGCSVPRNWTFDGGGDGKSIGKDPVKTPGMMVPSPPSSRRPYILNGPALSGTRWSLPASP